MTPAFRPAERSDVPAIAALFELSFVHTFAHLYRSEDLELFLAGSTVEAWQAEFDDPLYAFFVAEAGSDLVGFVKLGPPALPVERNGPAVELRSIYLHPDWIGRGLSAPMMDWAIGEARRRGAEELYLTVYVDNMRARRLYKRYGFVEIGPYAFMVGSQADEDIIMRLTL